MKILFWIRELAGWGLVLCGLVLIRQALLFLLDLENPRIIEASVITLGGLGVLRAGVLLVRISTAARVCLLPPAHIAK